MTKTPKWSFYVHRDFCIFVQWVQTIATRPDIQRRTFGFVVPLNNYLILSGDEYGDKHDTDHYGTLLAKKDRFNSSFFQQFAKREHKLATAAHAFQNRLNRNNAQYAFLTKKELAREYTKFLDVYVPIFGTAFVRPDDFLEQRVRALLRNKYSFGRADELFSSLATYPQNEVNKLNYLQEHTDLLNIAVGLQRSKMKLDNISQAIRRKIQLHLMRYQWLKNPNLAELVFITRPELVQRLRYLLQNNPAKQLHDLQRARKRHAQSFHALMKKERFSLKLRQAVHDLQTFIFLRTYTTESADRLFFTARQTILAEIARRMGLARDLVVTCSGDEIMRFLQSGDVPPKSELLKRTKNFVVLWKNGKGQLFFRKAAERMLQKCQYLRSVKTTRSTVLKGKTAFPGNVRGTVRVLTHWKEATKFRNDEILVVSMTTPEYIQAMEKASAFITDEGGITCHAAIIAREMQKPCVIGTGNATKVLKTGDRVEVDATKGIVNIIKQT